MADAVLRRHDLRSIIKNDISKKIVESYLRSAKKILRFFLFSIILWSGDRSDIDFDVANIDACCGVVDGIIVDFLHRG